MKNWTIKKRLAASVAAICALMLVLTVVSYFMLRQAKNAAHFMNVVAMPGMDAMSQIKGIGSDVQVDVLNELLAKTPEERKKFRAAIEASREPIRKFVDDYEKTVTTSEDRELFDKLKAARVQYITLRDQLLDLVDAGKVDEATQLNSASVYSAFDKYDTLVDQALALNIKNGDRETEQAFRSTDRATVFIIGISIVVLIFALAIGALISRGLNETLRQLALTLNDSSAQVASAASQVSSASQTLAAGASEQASSLEETSASLEEMSSMTKRNAENSKQANGLAKQAREAADRGVGDMQAMSAAMSAIKASSDDIAKIIKTIDEIAFQTNILALNAAVEAARAGEAGMGFAVVADEVRNLAQRCAQAAKETAGKIEGALGRTAEGVHISSKVAEMLNDIVAKVRQVDELVTEVTGASQEQTHGISQINAAVGQRDKVTQSNAANAEESAAAAEELNSQAEMTKQAVGELLQLVGGLDANTSHPPKAAAASVRKPFKPATNGNNGNRHTSASNQNGHSLTARRNEIPMDDDFKNF